MTIIHNPTKHTPCVTMQINIKFIPFKLYINRLTDVSKLIESPVPQAKARRYKQNRGHVDIAWHFDFLQQLQYKIIT